MKDRKIEREREIGSEVIKRQGEREGEGERREATFVFDNFVQPRKLIGTS